MDEERVLLKCSVADCEESPRCRGWCLKHYQRWRKAGDPQKVLGPAYWTISPEDRFWAKVDKTDADGCWAWTGTTQKGYGYIKIDGKKVRAHRYAFCLSRGYWPSGFILHSCDNPTCVNPSHLREGTPADNTADMVRRDRHMAGERNTEAKLTNDDVLKIRSRIAGGEKGTVLAEEFDVTSATISLIKLRRTWTHI